MTNMYTDPTPLEPKEPDYDQSKVSKPVKKHTSWIRMKMYGRHVREAISRAIEIIDLVASDALEIAKRAFSKSEDTENRLDNQISSLTEDSELIDFRHSKALDKTFVVAKKRGDFWDEQIIPALESPSKKYSLLSERLNDEIGNIGLYRPNENIVEKIKNSHLQTGMHVLDYGLVGDGNTKNDEAMERLLEEADRMINVFNARLPIVFPVGRFRFVKPIVIKNQRIMIKGSGFDTYLTSDYNLINLIVPREPEALSSTFIITDITLIAKNIVINSTDVETSVDISIHRVWFGKANRHLNGSFVTLNVTGNVFEQAVEGSIFSQTKGGFRKVVISGNNFYGNSKNAININGDTNYLYHHTININGNVFDQVHEKEEQKTASMIRLSFCKNFSIKGNIFNGEGRTPGSGMISLINCKGFELDNEHSTSKGTMIFAQNCHTFKLKGIAVYAEKTIHLAKCQSFDIDMIVSEMTDTGITIDNCDDFKVSGRVTEGRRNGIEIISSRDGVIDASITTCNKDSVITGSGLAIKTASGIGSKRIFVQNNKISQNDKYNIRIESGTEDAILTNINFGLDSKLKLLDEGTRTKQNNVYSFAA